MGFVETPSIPRPASKLLPKELALNDCERLRLKLNCVFSTSLVVQLWPRPRVTLWPRVDVCPEVSGKLPSVFARDELKLYAVLRLNLRLMACVTRTFTTSVL